MSYIARLYNKEIKHNNASHLINFFVRLRALRDMLESVARAEDIVKVHEARLTEKDTTSLSPSDVDEYMFTLKVTFSLSFIRKSIFFLYSCKIHKLVAFYCTVM